jgi:hypothetical protein
MIAEKFIKIYIKITCNNIFLNVYNKKNKLMIFYIYKKLFIIIIFSLKY